MLFVYIAIAVLILLVIWGVVAYNRLVRLRNRTQNSWAQIDVQLKKRHDLVPNLVETVKGYAAHEKGTFEAVVEARNAAVSASGVDDKAQAENMLTGALRSLFALAEDYPELRATKNSSGSRPTWVRSRATSPCPGRSSTTRRSASTTPSRRSRRTSWPA